ncbi:MAG: hypothetical protein ACTSR8_21870 [Promethearchaeota archaeon]
MKKPKKKSFKLRNLKDKFDNFSIDTKSRSVKLKYKALDALDKTKELLSSVSDGEDEPFLSEEDLAELQADLASLTADIKQKPDEQKTEWEEIKTFDTYQKVRIVEEIIPSIYEYWSLEFSAVFRFYLKKYEFKRLLYSFNNQDSVKIPLLARLFKKLKNSKFDNQTIIFLREEIED